MLLGTKRALLVGRLAARVRYLLRATFNAPNQGYADGQVLDTPAEGVQDGQLTVVEKDGTLAIVSNTCAFTVQATPSWGDLGFYETNGLARVLGRTLMGTAAQADQTDRATWVHFVDSPDCNPSGAAGNRSYIGNVTPANDLFVADGSWALGVEPGQLVNGTVYQLAIVLGGYDSNGIPWHDGAAGTFTRGASFFVKGGVWADWTLVWRSGLSSFTPLYAGFSNHDAAGVLDDFRVPDADLSAVLEPLAKSTFTAPNGTSLDAIAPEVGGAWNERTGNFDIQTNRANISATTGVRDVATVPATDADLFARTTIRKTVAADSGEFGHCLRWTDANNFWMVQGDLTNNRVEVIERNGGVETSRAFAAIALTHSTDYDIVAIADAQDITAFLDGGYRATYGSAALNENVAVHGVVGNQVGQTFDRYCQSARTAAVYDAELGAV